MTPEAQYVLVPLRNGAFSVRSIADAETFHPGIGPAAEAEALYVRQLQLCERVAAIENEFVIWDVGLGAAANALTAIRLIGEHVNQTEAGRLAPRAPSSSENEAAGSYPSRGELGETRTVDFPGAPRCLRIISFDQTAAAAEFAAQHAAELPYIRGFESSVRELIDRGSTEILRGRLNVHWSFVRGDFPSSLEEFRSSLPAPHAVLFDPHSPKKNPAMWTVAVFENLFHCLDPQRPCALANFTRSTMARVAMLLGGWFVGVGHASGMKEETTVAANRMELLNEPLNSRWLERVRRSDSAEPLWESDYRRAPLSERTSERLRNHPQFSAKQA
jgi:tRNA U34 5-methylaminomethyl-2-thiouridine-forming methyltransferase MnmC